MSTLLSINPTGHFKDSDYLLLQTAGLIPEWLQSYDVEGAEFSIYNYLNKKYSWGLFPLEGGEVCENGVYKYPEDSDLHPLYHFKHDRFEVYQYNYGIVAMRETDGVWFVTRMD